MTSYIVHAKDSDGTPLISKPVDFLFGKADEEDAKMVAIEEWEEEGVELDYDSVKVEPA